MAHRPEHIKRLTSAPTEAEAGIIVAALEQNGIKATFAGEATAGFRVEAPGWVQVLVAEEDMPQAQAILEDVRHHRGDIDWNQIDVGQPDDSQLPDRAPWWASLTLWRRIAAVLIIIWLIWVFANLGSAIIGLILRAIGLER